MSGSVLPADVVADASAGGGAVTGTIATVDGETTPATVETPGESPVPLADTEPSEPPATPAKPEEAQ